MLEFTFVRGLMMNIPLSSFAHKNRLANKKAAIRILRLSLLAFSATDLFSLSPKITRKIKRAV